MLRKLLKHDFLALLRVVGPALAALVLFGLLAIAAGFGLGHVRDVFPGNDYGNASENLAYAVLTIVCVLSVVAESLCSTVVLFAVVYRFYTNLFTDEGYLSFTLPVTSGAHLLSKVASGVTCLGFATGLTIVLLTLLLDSLSVSFGINFFLWPTDVLQLIGGDDTTFSIPFSFMDPNADISAIAFSVIALLRGMVTVGAYVVSTVVMAYAAFAIAQSVSSRHKVAAGVGFYFLISWGVNLVSSILLALVTFLISTTNSYAGGDLFTIAAFVVNTGIMIAASVASILVTSHFMGKKLNLA